MADDILARIDTSTGRRVLGVGSMWLLAFLVIAVALLTPPSFGWQVFLILIGGVALYIGEVMRRATDVSVELTDSGLRDSAGVLIAEMENIASIDRGMFAFKPSNGFLLRTTTRAPFHWRPGVWWRYGKSIGVGGMTPAGQAKAMSEIIAIKLAQREAEQNSDR